MTIEDLEKRVAALEERFVELLELFTKVTNQLIFDKGRELVADLEKRVAKAIEEAEE